MSASVGLAILFSVAFLGEAMHRRWHLPLPGPVIGLVLLSLVVYCGYRLHGRIRRRLDACLLPMGRLLVSHMGLLFVPAGVGVMSLGDTLRQSWLPLAAALVGSTIVGLVSTAWIMQRLTARAAA